MIEYRAIRAAVVQGLATHLSATYAIDTRTETIDATGAQFLHPAHRPIIQVVSLDLGATTLPADEYEVEDDRIRRVTGVWDDEVALEYEAGLASVPVILANQTAPRPSYPFMTYTFISPLRGGATHLGAYDPRANCTWVRDAHAEITVSLTAYSQDSDWSHEIALEAAAYLTWHGYLALKTAGVIVKRLEGMTNRDTLIVDDYERRIGFDAVLSVPSVIVSGIEGVETVDVERGP